MKYVYNGKLICRTAHHSKDSVEQTVMLKDDEVDFIRNYGADNFELWRTLDSILKHEYSLIEKYFLNFSLLYNEHYEDLKLHAIFTWNMPLYNSGLDIQSIIRLGSEKDKIIGTKEEFLAEPRICYEEKNPRYKIALLYYENPALFPKLCIKYANVNYQGVRTEFYSRPTHDTFKSVYHPRHFNCFGVCDLSDEQCEKILAHTDNLKEEYLSLYDKYLGECFPSDRTYNNIRDFVKEIVLPLIKGTVAPFYRSRFFKYLKKHIGKAGIIALNAYVRKYHKEIVPLYAIMDEKKNIVAEAKRMAQKQEMEIDSVQNAFDSSYNFLFLNFLKNEQRGRLSFDDVSQKELAPYKHKIDLLKKELNKQNDIINTCEEDVANFESHIERKIDEFCERLSHFAIWIQLFSHQQKINTYIQESYEKLYNLLWLRNPDKMRFLESHTCELYSPKVLVDSYNIDDIHHPNGANLRYLSSNVPFSGLHFMKWIRSRKSNEIIFRFNPRVIFEYWIKIILQERENIKSRQLESIRREEEARQAQSQYNQRNAHNRDKLLDFDKASHTYRVNGKVLDSVTALVERSFPKFNAEEHAKYTAARNGMTVQEVMEMWEKKRIESCESGTLLHEKIEKYYQGIDSAEDPAFCLFKQFANKITLRPYRTEWGVYDYDLGIAGSIDFVDYQNGEYSIYDWKRSDKLIANGLPVKPNKYGEKGNYPLEHLDNSPYYHYALQLSTYRYILERNYGIKVSHLRLGVFHPSYTKPYLLEMPYLEDEVSKLFGLRSEIIL